MNEPRKAAISSADPLGSRAVRVLRYIAAVAGICFVGAAFAAEWWGVGQSGFGRTQIFLVLAGLCALTMAALGRRFSHLYKAGTIVLFNTLVLLALVEVSAGVARILLHRSWTDTQRVSRQNSENLSYYAARTWSHEF